jgi:hypothetical protein
MKHHAKKPQRLSAAAALLGLTLLGTILSGGTAYAGHPTTPPTFPPNCPGPSDDATGWPRPLDPFCGLDQQASLW